MDPNEVMSFDKLMQISLDELIQLYQKFNQKMQKNENKILRVVINLSGVASN